ncbi:hypothetical protein ES708_23122 [subsurface metagenome]
MKRNLTPAEIGEQAAKKEYLQSIKPEPMRKISKDFKVAKPEINRNRRNIMAEYYGMQECAELVNSRWEHFVSLIKTRELFDKRLKEYESAK